MCGIAGILDLKGRGVGRPPVERLCAKLVHRGPDEGGAYADGPVALGQRRLSIIDLSGGHQPMGNEDGTVWITFNGEIYNFQELRPELERQGTASPRRATRRSSSTPTSSTGRTACPGSGGCSRSPSGTRSGSRLFLARDRVGKKPLFYAEADGQFVFASELQALLQHPGVSRELDPAAIDDYLTYGYVPAPATAFRGVYKLPPAHHLTIQLDDDGAGVRERKVGSYWSLDYQPKLDLDEEEAVDALEEVLTEAVRLRMVADVPLGALLSGGVDSSVVVALMSRLSSRPVKTFSIGFDEKGFNELPYARMVAERYGTEHHELVVRADAQEVIPTLVRHYGEPYADSSAIPSYYVARLTRQHVTVALNGDGGDESFAGYDRYWAAGLADRYQKLPAALRRRVIEPLAALVPDSLPGKNRLGRGKRFLRAASEPPGPRYLQWVTFFSPEQKRQLYTPGFRASLAGHEGKAWLLGLFDELRRGAPAGSTRSWPPTSGRTSPTTCS